MKLSKQTIDVLKSFAAINRHLVVHKGKVLRTINDSADFMARVEVTEKFPLDFGTHDLRQLNAALSQFQEPALKFKKDHVVIEEMAANARAREAQFEYSEITLLVYPNEDRYILSNVALTFQLKDVDLKDVLKAHKSMGHEQIEIVGSGGKLALVSTRSTTKGEKSAAKNYRVTIGQTPHKFRYITSGAVWKHMLPAGYVVEVSNDGAVHFATTTGVDYWMMVHDGSEFKTD